MSRQLAIIAMIVTQMIAGFLIVVLSLADASKTTLLVVVAVAIALDIFVFRWFLRCPKCKKHQNFRICFTCTHCPHCGANLND